MNEIGGGEREMGLGKGGNIGKEEEENSI